MLLLTVDKLGLQPVLLEYVSTLELNSPILLQIQTYHQGQEWLERLTEDSKCDHLLMRTLKMLISKHTTASWKRLYCLD